MTDVGHLTPLRPPALECTCGNSALCIACLLDEFTEEARAFWARPAHGARRLRLVTESDFAAMSYGPNDNHSQKAR